jgi:hypothetical protein
LDQRRVVNSTLEAFGHSLHFEDGHGGEMDQDVLYQLVRLEHGLARGFGSDFLRRWEVLVWGRQCLTREVC